MGTGELNAGDNPAMDLVTSCYRNQYKLWPGSLGPHADFTFLPTTVKSVTFRLTGTQ